MLATLSMCKMGNSSSCIYSTPLGWIHLIGKGIRSIRVKVLSGGTTDVTV